MPCAATSNWGNSPHKTTNRYTREGAAVAAVVATTIPNQRKLHQTMEISEEALLAIRNSPCVQAVRASQALNSVFPEGFSRRIGQLSRLNLPA